MRILVLNVNLCGRAIWQGKVQVLITNNYSRAAKTLVRRVSDLRGRHEEAIAEAERELFASEYHHAWVGSRYFFAGR